MTTLGHQVGLGDSDGGFGPRTLRHCFATQLLRGGADPVLVADLLGHTDLGTPLPRGADAYILCDILHDWDDTHAHHILTRVAAATGTTRTRATHRTGPGP